MEEIEQNISNYRYGNFIIACLIVSNIYCNT